MQMELNYEYQATLDVQSHCRLSSRHGYDTHVNATVDAGYRASEQSLVAQRWAWRHAAQKASRGVHPKEYKLAWPRLT